MLISLLGRVLGIPIEICYLLNKIMKIQSLLTKALTKIKLTFCLTIKVKTA